MKFGDQRVDVAEAQRERARGRTSPCSRRRRRCSASSAWCRLPDVVDLVAARCRRRRTRRGSRRSTPPAGSQGGHRSVAGPSRRSRGDRRRSPCWPATATSAVAVGVGEVPASHVSCGRSAVLSSRAASSDLRVLPVDRVAVDVDVVELVEGCGSPAARWKCRSTMSGSQQPHVASACRRCRGEIGRARRLVVSAKSARRRPCRGRAPRGSPRCCARCTAAPSSTRPAAPGSAG